MVSISLTVYYTKAALEAANNNIGGLLQDQIDFTNQALRNSNVRAKLNVRCLKRYDVDDMITGNIDHDLSSFMDLRQDSSDIGILYVSPSEKHHNGINGMAASRFRGSCAVVQVGAVELFAHEIGHLLGAGHDAFERDWSGSDNAAYFMANGASTIMAYNYEHRYRTEPPHFSSDTVRLPDGTPTGDKRHNNAKTMNEFRFYLSEVGNEDEHRKCGL